MRKILQCIGTLVYSTIAGYLLWLLFYWITPYIMGVGWLFFLLYVFLVGGLIAGFIGSINSILLTPVTFLMNDNILAKIINTFPFLFFGYSAVIMPWKLEMDYGFLQYLIGISLTITFLISFISMIIAPFNITDKE